MATADFLIWFDYWKLTTFVLAAVAACVAYAHYRLSRERIKLELFEKRFKVFTGASLFLRRILEQGGLPDLEPLGEFRTAIEEAKFLFNEDITDYLDEIYRHAVSLHNTAKTSERLPVRSERSRLVDENAKTLAWLLDQLPELTVRFSPYLTFRRWR
jgi:hypothetical protein